MTDEKWLELSEFYQKVFPTNMTLDDISDKLDTLNIHPMIKDLRRIFCNDLVSILTEGFVKYDEKEIIAYDGTLIKLLYDNIEKLGKEEYFYWGYYYYLKKQYKKCKENIHKLCETQVNPLDETAILDLFLVPYKNAPDDIWNFITEEIRKIKVDDGIVEFCEVISLYYRSKNNDEVIDALTSFIQRYPNFKSTNELLGYTYYNMSMWNNAIACFEKVEEEYYFYMGNIYWMLAWSYGKLKNYREEEKYYRKSIEIAPEMEFSFNNLGYCLYKQKKYREALEVFKQCLDEGKDLSYAGANYVRVLIALGRNADAKKFIKADRYKVSKSMKDKVAKQDNHNARLKKDAPIDISEIDDTEGIEKAAIDMGVKRHQFSNEKLLEDELTARIENGVPVFGLNLKVYKRKGEYGRQYIIPVGRLDLLCEDNAGNLYVIELKKDSGYDDAYKQTAEYLDWFEKSPKFKDKKVYGIICLNNPTKELIDKVHADKRMKLFEYQISYTER